MPKLSRPLVIFGVWTGFALIAAVEKYTYCQLTDMPAGFWPCVLARSPAWYVWALATPAILKVTAEPHSWPPSRALVAKHSGLFLATWAAFVLAQVFLDRTVQLWPNKGTFAQQYVRSLLGWSSGMIFAYGLIALAGAALAANLRRSASERREATLTTELVRAQLSALKSQLHPHFLFNSLNTAVTFVRQGDMKTAERTLLLLSDILRDVLRQGNSPDVTLREEMAVLRRYLEIHQLRFADRLRVSWTIEDAVLDARVPLLLLQPVVENAVRHGIARRASAGALGITASRDGDRLFLTVKDDGPGPPDGFVLAACSGLGLRNVRERLEQEYGAKAEFCLERTDGGGALARIVLPFRVALADETPALSGPASPSASSAGVTSPSAGLLTQNA